MIKYEKIDAHEYPELTSTYGIMSAPVVVVLQDGKEINRVVGYTTKEQLKGAIANG